MLPSDICLAANDLPRRWAGAARFVVLESAFGDGDRFLATWRAWQSDPQRPARLHYLALCAAPLPVDAAPPPLRAAWPPQVPGFHRLELDGGRVTLDLMAGPPDASLGQIDARVDAFYLHAAAPSMTPLARLAAPGATLAAPAALAPRLAAAGFRAAATADGGPLRAVFAGRQPPPVRTVWRRRAIVVGAGLAGAAACERLTARGWHVTLIERHGLPAQEASGNLAGIFMPQLAKDDNPAARLSRAAFLFALRYWDGLGGVGTSIAGARCGVLHLARDAAHARVQREIAAARRYPPEFARWLEPDAAAALLGAPAPDGGWLFGQGGWARPASVCQAMLDACGDRLTRIWSSDVLQLTRAGDAWQARTADGVAAEAPLLILANGTGATALAQAAALPLAAVRGQVTHVAPGVLPAPPLVVCREAYLTPPSDGVVSAGASYDADPAPELRRASQSDNLTRVAAIFGRAPPSDQALAGRVGFRCVAPDRLPLIGALPHDAQPDRVERLRDVARWPGVYGLLGYASRGLIWAPLGAELLAAQLDNEPLPLESGLVAALDPARFLLKARRRT